MSVLSLGVIGMSEGNGHPYSWSAIFNGYDRERMEDCGFPVIPRYLEKQHSPESRLVEAKVTHCWTQDPEVTVRLSAASLIPNVVDRYTDMLGQVDGLLLARDDAEHHFEFAGPFLMAGIPVFIDKPLALSTAAAKRLLDLQLYPGQVFSCSALRYARELQLTPEDRQHVGPLRKIHATVPKSWNKYAVHALEPALLLAGEHGPVARTQSWKYDDGTTLAVGYSDGFQLLVSSTGMASAPIALRVMGESGWKDLIFTDSYSAFRSALADFIGGIKHKDVRIQPEFMLNVVELVEAGTGM